jgi:glycerol-3-phosphate acyltransferase PlsX
LKNSHLNFVGNLEGKDIFRGVADVFVCDGFVGNIILKYSEGVVGAVFQIIKEEVKKSFFRQLSMAFMAPFLAPIYLGFKKRTDFEEYGGAPLLGVDGLVFIAHGRSRAKAIKNALLRACEAYDNQLVMRLRESVLKNCKEDIKNAF